MRIRDDHHSNFLNQLNINQQKPKLSTIYIENEETQELMNYVTLCQL